MTDDTHARELPDGTIEIVDDYTGEVVETRPSFEYAYQSRAAQGLVRSLTYSHHLGDIICQRIASGQSLSKICNTPGFPSMQTISRWTMQHPLFKQKFKMARRAIALKCAERMLDVAEVDLEEGTVGYIEKDDAPGKKIQLDTLKWLAEKSDSEFFTTKHVQHHGDSEQPIRFIIETGIDRSASNVVEADSKEIDDADLTRSSERTGRETLALPEGQGTSEQVSRTEEELKDSSE